jgi:hypothetical protein
MCFSTSTTVGCTEVYEGLADSLKYTSGLRKSDFFHRGATQQNNMSSSNIIMLAMKVLST